MYATESYKAFCGFCLKSSRVPTSHTELTSCAYFTAPWFSALTVALNPTVVFTTWQALSFWPPSALPVCDISNSVTLCFSFPDTLSLLLDLCATHSFIYLFIFYIDSQGINFERECLLSLVLRTLPSNLLASEDLRRVLARRCAVINSSSAER